MNAAVFFWPNRALARCLMAGAGGWLMAATAFAEPPWVEEPSAAVTNIWQLEHLISADQPASHAVHLEGNVWWANPAQGRLVLQDASGAAELVMDLRGSTFSSGQRVRLDGNGTITRKGAAFQIGTKGPVVDNNGIHGMIEKSGVIHLTAGRHPIRVEWFNGVVESGLEVYYEGPGLRRQRIPAQALFRMQVDAAGGTSNLMNGLAYRCCAVPGNVLPDFNQLPALHSGTAANFDAALAAGREHVGLQFDGYLEVPREGSYTFWTKSDDGSRLYIGELSVRLEAAGTATYPAPRSIAIGQTLRENEEGQWVEIEGKVTFARAEGGGLLMELSAGASHVRMEIAEADGLSPALLLNRRIRATGFCQSALTTDGQKVPGVLLVPGRQEVQLIETSSLRQGGGGNADSLPVLTTAGEVHRLKREEAQRGYPVKFSGVVTCVQPELQAFTLQDSTRGLYVVDVSEGRSGPPEIGEFLEVEGVTDPSLFAPIVNARRVSSLGAGHLPEPVRPTWDQLMNGSLDAQYVEIQGIITEVQTNGITLLTSEGVTRLELRVTGMRIEEVKRFENALVRVRGCLQATWDYLTHQVKVGEIRVYGADLLVDQPAPADLFSSPEKTAADLLLFDPQASVFQRVKVSGQIVYVREPEYFMMQGGNGLRFILKARAGLKTGDLVEVVGFPELSGNVSPVLREAVARKTGQASLPDAKKLPPDDLIRAEHDSTRVRVEGLLAGVRRTQSDQILEMQSVRGVRTFAARLNSREDAVESLAVGSRLELAGVYAGQGGSRAGGQGIASFELLLNSAADIRVLARPPWWTLERLLIIVGALACVLTAAALWITQLHRQVEQRTAELGAQIQERQRVEHQRAMEEERARIAQDLHDELGSGITEISMLAARAKSASVPEGKRSGYLDQAGGKAREMVAALDEIVWAMNPHHDSLASLVSYFCLYADRFLGLAGITWQIEAPSEAPDCVLSSRHRHQLFLAFKEALTNVVRHSGAAGVRLGIQVEQGQVRLSIADNGRGLPAGARTEDMNGVANMRSRVEKLGGRFEITSEPGRGTTVRFSVPTNKEPKIP